MRPGCNWRFQPDARTKLYKFNWPQNSARVYDMFATLCNPQSTEEVGTMPGVTRAGYQASLANENISFHENQTCSQNTWETWGIYTMCHLSLGISHLQLRLPPKSKAILGARPHRCRSPYLHAAGDQSWALVNGAACWTHKMLIFFLAAIHLELPVNQFWTMVSHIEPCLIVFVWPAQHFQQLRIMSRGRRGIWSTLWIFPVAISPGRRSTWRTLWSKSGALLSETCNHNVLRAVKKWEI